MMKDYLEFQGFEVKSPRETIKQAFSYSLIEKGDIWLFALKDRNLTIPYILIMKMKQMKK